MRAAEAKWSGVFAVDPELFAAYVTERRPSAAHDPAAAWPHCADLYLACGCALGIAPAVAAFEAILQHEAALALRHMQLQPSVFDEVCQMARERMLVRGAARAPRIAEYAGHGALRGWLRVSVTRIALNALRDQKSEIPIEAALVDQPATDSYNPELACLKDRFGDAFKAALDLAMRSLTTEERVLLRQRFVDGLTSEQLALLHHKHRITMLRRVTAILRTVRIRTQAHLERNIGCGRATAISIVNQMLSQIHLSIPASQD